MARRSAKKPFIVDDEAAVVRKIYDMAEFGVGSGPMGTRSIAQWLHTHGYTMRGARSSMDRSTESFCNPNTWAAIFTTPKTTKGGFQQPRI